MFVSLFFLLPLQSSLHRVVSTLLCLTMAANQQNTVDELFRSVERSQEQYLQSLKALHETMHGVARSPSVARGHRMERSGSNDIAPTSPVVRAGSLGDSSPLPVSRATFASDASLSPGDRRPRRLTNELADRTRLARMTTGEYERIEWENDDDIGRITPLPLLLPSQTQGSSSTGDPTCWPRVQKLLTPRSYTRTNLVHHIQQISDEKEATAAALGNVFARRKELNESIVFTPGPDPLSADKDFSTYEVYDIKTDGLAVTRHDDRGTAEGEVLDADVVWDTIKVRIYLSRIYNNAQPADKHSECEHRQHDSRENNVRRSYLLMKTDIHLTRSLWQNLPGGDPCHACRYPSGDARAI